MVWLFGIDSAAHIGALENNGKTIAILGSGFNNIFPKENIKLFHEIINNGGLVISEYPPDTKADSKRFLERNRLVSGISIGVLVIEALYRSGTSVTCKFAREQGKKIFCIPHNLENKYGIGTNKLLKNGAHLVTSAKDIISEYDFLNYKEQEKIKNEKHHYKINVEYKDVYDILNGPPLNIEQICNKAKKPISQINNTLLMLELEGAIIKTQYGYQANK